MKPCEYLHHRQPFLLLDSAEMVGKGNHARGKKLLTIDDPLVLQDGSLPSVYVIEAMAQISGIAVGRKERSRLAGLKGIRFDGSVHAGDTLQVESRLERKLTGLYMFACRASVSGKTVAEGEIILHFDETA